MNPMLGKVRASTSTFLKIATAIMTLIACTYLLGPWRTFVGGMLIIILFKVSDLLDELAKAGELRNDFSELKRDIRLTQDLVRGPPQMRTIPATELKSGMYLYGGELICGVHTLENGSIMAHPESEETDSPWLFAPNEMVEVTDRSLLIYEGGVEQVSAARWKRINLHLKSGIVIPDEDS